MKICERVECNNPVKRVTSRFCSLSCSSLFNAKRTGRTMHKIVCLSCDITFESPDRNRVYCSRSCSAKVNNSKYQKKPPSSLYKDCGWCYTRNYGKPFCNKLCRNRFEVYEWLAGRLSGNATYAVRSFVRMYISARSGGRCEGIDSRTGSRCIEDRVVQLDHIDGDPYNSIAENLRHLCPTCHTLTPTYAGKNRGNGRAWKSMYNQYKTT